MLYTNHGWDRSGTGLQPDFVAITDDSRGTTTQRYRIYTGEPVGGSP